MTRSPFSLEPSRVDLSSSTMSRIRAFQFAQLGACRGALSLPQADNCSNNTTQAFPASTFRVLDPTSLSFPLQDPGRREQIQTRQSLPDRKSARWLPETALSVTRMYVVFLRKVVFIAAKVGHIGSEDATSLAFRALPTSSSMSFLPSIRVCASCFGTCLGRVMAELSE